MSEIEFREESHTYWKGSQQLPSVTGILKVICDYAGIPKAILDKAAARGTAIHKACELAHLGTLDWASLDDELIPYVMAHEQFRHDMRDRLRIISVEKRVFHPALMYAGTLDIEAEFDDKNAVIDIKSSVALMPSVGPQLSGYQDAENATRKKPDQIKTRYGLKLGKDGKYRLKQYKDDSDLNVFKSCLQLVRFNEQHKGDYSAFKEVFSFSD